MSLREYRKKRDFSKTKEPVSGKKSKKVPIFVVQEHWATHHHFDFRLEAFGTLKSWAVPKGPSIEVGDKRLAVEVEDHPIDYAHFHGTIPEGEYGAGEVEIWDKGSWVPPEKLKENLSKGHLEFELNGKKLKGKWLLQRTGKIKGRKSQWLLIKRHDDKTAAAEALPKKVKRDSWPTGIQPQLATLTSRVPPGAEWIHEIKLDGYRTLTYLKGPSVQLKTRNGLDWSKKYSLLAQEFKKLKIESAIFDGEVVVMNAQGHSDFSALQKALKEGNTEALQYYLFDLLYLNGQDLRDQPLETRKQLLKALLQKAHSPKLIFSTHWRGQGEELFKQACRMNLEGIVSKSFKKPYRERRTDEWLKTKCALRQELVIGGYTEPSGSRAGFGALLMGLYENGKFKYVGRVGTGFNDETLSLLYKKLKKIEIKKNPFVLDSPGGSRHVHWVKPKIVSEVSFRAWTSDGILRQASFQGLREDKKAEEVVMEVVKVIKNKKPANVFTITHPDRIIYPDAGVTKMDVANYYRSVAPWLLRHTGDRPLSLVRCPDKIGASCFFQKHIDSSKMHAVKGATVSATDEKDQKINYIETERGLLELIQWGVLEIHTWQSHVGHASHPDQILFDLDPDESVDWRRIVEAAFDLKDLLERLSLKSFVKTTGGKGLHIHVPIAPIYNWKEVKEFSKSVAKQLESENPGLYTLNMSKKARKGKIFVDYLRNGFGSTSIAPYSLRNKQEPFAALPITWNELKALKGPQYFTKDRVLKHLAANREDPWPGYSSYKQKIKILSH